MAQRDTAAAMEISTNSASRYMSERWSPDIRVVSRTPCTPRIDVRSSSNVGKARHTVSSMPLSATTAASMHDETVGTQEHGITTGVSWGAPLIVFDWDDTMLPSSWIQTRALLQAGSYDDLPSDVRRDLASLEQSAVKCLKNAHTLGTVIIITNAESGWVELSAAKFFVNLLPLLEGIPIVSARSLFEAQFPGSPLCWKSAAFAYMMHEHFMDHSRWHSKLVVSIGDSNEEKVAMRIASGQHANMTTKAIKFVHAPDPGALSCQLDIVTTHLEGILSYRGDVELVLSPSMVNATCSPASPSKLANDKVVAHAACPEQGCGKRADIDAVASITTNVSLLISGASRPIPIPGRRQVPEDEDRPLIDDDDDRNSTWVEQEQCSAGGDCAEVPTCSASSGHWTGLALDGKYSNGGGSAPVCDSAGSKCYDVSTGGGKGAHDVVKTPGADKLGAQIPPHRAMVSGHAITDEDAHIGFAGPIEILASAPMA